MTTTIGSEQRDRGRPGERTPNLTSSDPYAVLGVMRGASLREVKRAYFDLVRQYPPEQHPDVFKIIRAAYEKLRTAEVKAETDLFLFRPPAPWQPRKRRKKLDLQIHLEDVVVSLQVGSDLTRTDFKADYEPIQL